jgi:hypothetical protein
MHKLCDGLEEVRGHRHTSLCVERVLFFLRAHEWLTRYSRSLLKMLNDQVERSRVLRARVKGTLASPAFVMMSCVPHYAASTDRSDD